MVFAGAGGHAIQPIDEGHHHFAHGGLGLGDALFEQALFVDHLAQGAAGLFDGADVQRAGNQLPHHRDLALQPAAIIEEFADVLQQQIE